MAVDKVEKRATKHLNELYEEFSKKCNEYNSANDGYHTTWKNDQDNKLVQDITDIGVLETHSECEVWIPRLYINMFPFRLFYDFETISNKKETVKKKYRQWLDGMNYEVKQEQGIRNFVIEGTVWYKMYWSFEMTEKVKYTYEEVVQYSKNPLVSTYQHMVAQMTGKEPTIIERTEKYYHEPMNAPQMREVPSERLIYDVDLNTFDDLTWVMELADLRYSDMKAKEKDKDGNGIYINLDVLKKKVIDKRTDIEKDLDSPIECVEYWGLFDIDNTGTPVQCTIVKPVDIDIILRMERNQYKHKKIPYVKTRFLAVKNRLPGMGIPELIRRPQAELDSKRSLVAATESMHLFGETIIGANVQVKKGAFENPRPGKVTKLLGGRPEDVKLRERQYHIEGALKLEGVVKDDMRRAAKVSPTQFGEVKGGETTAYEVSSALRESNQSIKFVIERYTVDIIEKSLWFIKQMVDQYIDDNEVFDMDGIQLTAMDIKSVGKWKAIGMANMEDQALELKTATDLFNAAQAAPMVQDGQGQLFPIDTKKIFIDYVKAKKKEDAESYVGVKPMQPQGQGGGQGEGAEDKGGNPLSNAIQSMLKIPKLGG